MGSGREGRKSAQLEPSGHGHGCKSVQKEEAQGGLVLPLSWVWVSLRHP